MKKPVLLFITLTALCGSLFAETLPAPEKDEMSIIELATKLIDLDGKIIETEITYAEAFFQIAPNTYQAECFYDKGSSFSLTGDRVLIPKEGKEFFEEMAKRDFLITSSRTVYLLVRAKSPVKVEGEDPYKLEAVGTKYRKSKHKYSW